MKLGKRVQLYRSAAGSPNILCSHGHSQHGRIEHTIEMKWLAGEIGGSLMFIHNDESINAKFLYRKPVVIGVLDDSDNDFNDMSWMVDNSWELLKMKFSESSFQELVIGMVEIFIGGQPNYSTLGEMFGNDTIVKGDAEKVVYHIANIERNSNDIIRVEMYLDPMNRSIKDLFLYVQEGLDLLTLKAILCEKYEGLSIELNGKFIITGRDYRIIIGSK